MSPNLPRGTPSRTTTMSSEPLRRVLFPTPPRNDDGTSTRSIQRIRPKPELSPVNLESTPTFKQLVDNSPVPLAVAAATAAMRAARNSQAGRPIITDMTRAAEEVVKNREYNSIRPPHLSPRSLSSPRILSARAAQSGSTSLPPIPSPTRRRPGVANILRSIFMPRRTYSRSSLAPTNNATQLSSDTRRANQGNQILGPTESPSRAVGKQIAPSSFRQPNFNPSTSDKQRRGQVVPPGKQPFPRAKSDPLSRIFRVVSPVPVGVDDRSPIGRHESLEDANSEIEASEKTAETIEKRRKKRTTNLPTAVHEVQASEIKENVTARMQTRSLKRSRPDSNPMVAGASKSGTPKKRRRMSEVLRLQKALESAAWTNSRTVEKQTEVIVISDNSPSRPRTDVESQNRNPSEDNLVLKVVRNGIPRGNIAVEKKTKLTKRASSAPVPVKRKRKVNEERRKRISVKKSKLARADDGKEVAANGTPEASIRKKRTKTEMKEKRKRLDRLAKTVSLEKKKPSTKNSHAKGKNISAKVSTTTATGSPIPLKKRLTAKERNENSLSKSKFSDIPNSSHTFTDTRLEKSSRKTRNPKRLNPPVSTRDSALQSAKENSTKTKERPVVKGKS